MANRENRIPIQTTVSQTNNLLPPVPLAVTFQAVLTRKLLAFPHYTVVSVTTGVTETKAVF